MAAESKTSRWVKKGQVGAHSDRPGSYAGYVKERKAPRAYPTTAQQKKVASAGRAIGEKCKGKTGTTYRQCRSEVMQGIFG